jgi:hypothetical protein
MRLIQTSYGMTEVIAAIESDEKISCRTCKSIRVEFVGTSDSRLQSGRPEKPIADRIEKFDVVQNAVVGGVCQHGISVSCNAITRCEPAKFISYSLGTA